MLAEQRHQYILSELDKHGALAVGDLVCALAVSRETVRRDLNALAERGLVTMTHGGALSVDRREPHVDVRAHANAAAKQRIGERAANFVPDGASLIVSIWAARRRRSRARCRTGIG